MARKRVPFSIECKNQESLNIWKALEQASTHAQFPPALVFRRNNTDTYVAIPFESLIELLGGEAGGIESLL